MNRKVFAQRFNRELAVLEFPDEIGKKVEAVARVFDVPRYAAKNMLLGEALPSVEQLDRIAQVLEICPDWLGGASDKKKAYSGKELLEETGNS